MILGLDISTSLTGLTILDEKGSVILNEVIDLRIKKYETMMQKAAAVKNKLTEVFNKYKIENVFIEQSLNAFRPGLSSAQVILT